MTRQPIPQNSTAATSGQTCRARPAGFTLVELLMTSLMLGVVFSITLPVIGRAVHHSRTALQREEALQAAANVLERLTVRPWAELTPETAAAVTLSDSLRRQLPNAELTVTVTPTADGGKRVQVALEWTGRSGQPAAPVRLSAWVYPREERS